MKKAFSLVEILVVLAIITIISGLVLTSFDSSRNKAEDDRMISDLRSLAVFLESRKDFSNNTYPAVSDTIPTEVGGRVFPTNNSVNDGLYGWADNTESPNKFCIWANLDNSDSEYFIANQTGTGFTDTEPTSVDNCVYDSGTLAHNGGGGSGGPGSSGDDGSWDDGDDPGPGGGGDPEPEPDPEPDFTIVAQNTAGLSAAQVRAYMDNAPADVVTPPENDYPSYGPTNPTTGGVGVNLYISQTQYWYRNSPSSNWGGPVSYSSGLSWGNGANAILYGQPDDGSGGGEPEPSGPNFVIVERNTGSLSPAQIRAYMENAPAGVITPPENDYPSWGPTNPTTGGTGINMYISRWQYWARNAPGSNWAGPFSYDSNMTWGNGANSILYAIPAD